MQDRFQYRAKDVNTGEWHYGFYAELPYGLGSSGCNGEYADVDSFILNCKTKQSALYSNAEPHEIVVAEQNRIDIKTLSQCTGLKDKNGKLIYEGDIVDCYVSSKKIYRYQIKQEIGSFMLVSPKEEIFDFINKWNDNVYPLSQLYFEYENEENCIEQCEIIGNIYENPELLESEPTNE